MAPHQSIVLDIVDFIDEIVSKKPKAHQNTTVTISYFVVVSSTYFVWHTFSDKDFSFVMTMAAMSQTLAFFLLLHKMRAQKSAEGISSKMLQMYCLVIMFRLTSTMTKNGYLPMDSTGDWVYQACDITSLLLVFQALFLVHKRYKTTYQEHLDTLPVGNMVPPALLLACFVHGDLNHSRFFDTMWAIGMNLDTIAMLPQLWMFVKQGGAVDKLASHYVALMFYSRGLLWMFWYTGFPELGVRAAGNFNMIGWMMMTTHTLQLLFYGDFMMHYFVWQGQECKDSCEGRVSSAPRGIVLPAGSVHDM